MGSQTDNKDTVRDIGAKPVLLRMENIEKNFPGVKALDKVSLSRRIDRVCK